MTGASRISSNTAAEDEGGGIYQELSGQVTFTGTSCVGPNTGGNCVGAITCTICT